MHFSFSHRPARARTAWAPLLVLLLALGGRLLAAHSFYVAPTGSDSQPGTLELPFASIARAQDSMHPGDTTFIRGGLYSMSEAQISRRSRIFASVICLEKSGTPDAPLHYIAYPGETPVFDFSALKPAGMRVSAFLVEGSWIELKGFEVTGVQVTILTHTQSICFENQGSHNLYENLSMHDGQAIGIYSVRGSDNLFLNCDAYRNFDFTSENKKGGNTDGFGCHPPPGATGNVFRGCRAWLNSDDGFDCINASETVTFENCWAFQNGLSVTGAGLGDGNGFKAGGYGSTPVDKLPAIIPGHRVRFCIAFKNRANGFYSNHHLAGSDWLNNSAYKNAVGFNMLNRLPDNITDVPGSGHRLENNLSFENRIELRNLDPAHNTSRHNSFEVHLSAGDFVSLDESQLTRPRQPDGSLPEIDFLRPVNPALGMGAQ